VSPAGSSYDGEPRLPPGVEEPRRFRPRLRYELIGCGLHGHELLGTTAAQLRAEDAVVVRDAGNGLRWYRCLRCDSWLPLPAPDAPTEAHLPDHDLIELPLRGKPLRDRYVLRLIALDRFVHCVVLAALAIAVFAFLDHRAQLHALFYRVMGALQAGVGGPAGTHGGITAEISRAFDLSRATLWALGLALVGYAVLEGVEGLGLWWGRRWAEYLTLVATSVLLVPEVYELARTLSATKVLTLVVNLAIVVYLLLAKRLFGLRGGGRAEAAERDRDTGWPALRSTLPSGWDATSAPPASEAPGPASR
jgi:uncharacterized membrane protein (DUF2068 family)